MAKESGVSIRDVLTPGMFPVFLMFFFWGFGTGGLWLARPLFAFELGNQSFFLVALVSAVSAMPRLVTGPVTGYLADRFGRRPFIVLGSVFHIIALFGQFTAESYLQFFLMEIIAGIGIAVWMTSASALLADSTEVRTRGRAVAIRESSSRIGLLSGPIVGGLIAGLFGLRYVFLFIAVTKLIVIIVTVLLIREARSKEVREAQAAARRRPSETGRADPSMFKNRAFVALAISTLSVGLVVGGTGVFRTLFPAQADVGAGLSTFQIGNLITAAGILALIGSFPAGMANDRFGRKRPLMFGLLVTSLATYLMSGIDSFTGALIAVMVFGLAEAAATGTIQVYAMDLAPEERRGAFLGVWSLFTNMGQITGPLVVGGMADLLGFTTAFIVVAGVLVTSAVVVFVLGVETAGRRASAQPAAREDRTP